MIKLHKPIVLDVVFNTKKRVEHDLNLTHLETKDLLSRELAGEQIDRNRLDYLLERADRKQLALELREDENYMRGVLAGEYLIIGSYLLGSALGTVLRKMRD